MSPPKTSRTGVEDISPMVIRQNNDLSKRLHHTIDFSVSSSLSNFNHYNNHLGFETDSLSATSSFIAIFPSSEKKSSHQNRSSYSTSFFYYNNKTSEEGETMRSLRTKWEQEIQVNPTDRSGLRKRKKRPAPPPPSLLTRRPFTHVPGKRKAPTPPQLKETFPLVHEQQKCHLAPSSTLVPCSLASPKGVIKLDYGRDSGKRALEPSEKTSVLVKISQLDRETTEIIHVERQKESMHRRMDDERFYKRRQPKEELEMEKANRDVRQTIENQKTEEKNLPIRDHNKEWACCLVCTFCIDRLWRHTLRRINRNTNQRKTILETLIMTSSVICLCSTLQWQTETIKGYFNTTKNPDLSALPILSKMEQHNNTTNDAATLNSLRKTRQPNFSTAKIYENVDENRSKSFHIVESSMGNYSRREAAPSLNTKMMISSLLHSLEESIASDQFDQAVFIAKELAAFKRSSQDMINNHPKEFNSLLIKELDSGPAPPPIIKPHPPLRITSLHPSNAVLHPQPSKRGFKYGIHPIIN